MRSLIFISCLLLGGIQLNSQTKSINTFYSIYKHQDDVMHVTLPGWLIRFGLNFVDDNDIPKELLRRVKKARFLMMENGNQVWPEDYDWLLMNMRDEGFRQIMAARGDGAKVKVLLRESRNDRYLSNLVLLLSEPDEFVLLSLKGRFFEDELHTLVNEFGARESGEIQVYF